MRVIVIGKWEQRTVIVSGRVLPLREGGQMIVRAETVHRGPDIAGLDFQVGPLARVIWPAVNHHREGKR